MTAMREKMQAAETEAFVAGRRARGNNSWEITEAEAAMLNGRNSRNMKYFGRFLDQIADGHLDKPGSMPAMKRAKLYASSLWSIYNRGDVTDWAEPENQNARYMWVLDVEAEHCHSRNGMVGCLERARQSRDQDGFTWDELIELGFPGENTPCMVNCRCHVQTIKGPRMVATTQTDPAETPEKGLEQFIEAMGSGMKARIPAAGVPSVGVTSTRLLEVLQDAGSSMDEVARRLPQIPNVLAYPAIVSQPTEDSRLYIGQGMTVKVGRDSRGLWEILSVLLGVPDLTNPMFESGFNPRMF